jgi:hypothetical protein
MYIDILKDSKNYEDTLCQIQENLEMRTVNEIDFFDILVQRISQGTKH